MVASIKKYHLIMRIIHWSSALIIFSLFFLGYWMTELSYYSAWYTRAPHWHKSVGLCLFALTLIRLVYKRYSLTPKISGKTWEIYSAKTVHFLLYLLLFTLFISGYMISSADGRSIEIFNWFALPSLGSMLKGQADVAGVWHQYIAYSLISLAVLHGLAALKHHFLDKDNTLTKML